MSFDQQIRALIRRGSSQRSLLFTSADVERHHEMSDVGIIWADLDRPGRVSAAATYVKWRDAQENGPGATVSIYLCPLPGAIDKIPGEVQRFVLEQVATLSFDTSKDFLGATFKVPLPESYRKILIDADDDGLTLSHVRAHCALGDANDVTQKIFCRANSLDAIDNVVSVGGRLVGAYSQKTIDEMMGEYPDVIMTTLKEYGVRHDLALKTAPREIDEQVFIDAIECLPPHDWVMDGAEESFKMIERTSGDVTQVYARIGGRHFCMSEDIRIPHSEIISKVKAAFFCEDAEEMDISPAVKI